MKKILKWVGIILLAAILLGSAGFVIWAETPLGPEQAALDALKSDETVTVTQTADYIAFQPSPSAGSGQALQPSTGFIFYPGGHVDYRSYAPALRLIAVQGYLVVLVPAPLNLMVFAPARAESIFPKFPSIQHWALGGHSLGGAMAAYYLYSHPGKIDGLVLWASYPAENNSLAQSGLKVVSIYGTEDMGGMEIFDQSHALLPPDTAWVVIEGGNHAQFGAYGPQPGDNLAAIPAASQWQQAADATTQFLGQLSK